MKTVVAKSLAAGLLCLVLLPSCAQTKVSDYAFNRASDFVDILRVSVKAGKGVGLEYSWTGLTMGGVLWEDEVWAAGLGNREVGYWQESVFFWGVLVGHHSETIHSGLTAGRYSGSYGWNFGEGGSGIEAGQPDNLLSLLTARAAVMLGIGIDIEIRYGEALDFLAGLAQFDPADDDVQYSNLRTTTN